jgi:hypothetical protein
VSGHLKSLVTVARPTTPKLAPRRRSRFEPPGPVDPSGLGVPREEHAERIIDRPPSTPAQAEPTGDRPSRRRPGPAAVERPIAEPAVTKPARSARPARPALRPAAPVSSQPGDAEPAAGPRARAPIEAQRSADDPSEPSSATTSRLGPHARSGPAPTAALPERSRSARPPDRNDETARGSRAGVLLAPPLPTSAPALVSPTSTRPPPDGVARPAASPDVQITIGRLEVRAGPGTGPPPQRPPRRAPGVLSLEEYGSAKGRVR